MRSGRLVLSLDSYSQKKTVGLHSSALFLKDVTGEELLFVLFSVKLFVGLFGKIKFFLISFVVHKISLLFHVIRHEDFGHQHVLSGLLSEVLFLLSSL